jgi:hypothetical protein
MSDRTPTRPAHREDERLKLPLEFRANERYRGKAGSMFRKLRKGSRDAASRAIDARDDER